MTMAQGQYSPSHEANQSVRMTANNSLTFEVAVSRLQQTESILFQPVFQDVIFDTQYVVIVFKWSLQVFNALMVSCTFF